MSPQPSLSPWPSHLAFTWTISLTARSKCEDVCEAGMVQLWTTLVWSSADTLESSVLLSWSVNLSAVRLKMLILRGQCPHAFKS